MNVDTDARTLVVTGGGTASAIPDQCKVYVDLNAMAESASEALDRVSLVARSVIDDLKATGLADGDVRTTNISVSPYFDRDEKRVTAHAAKYQMTVLSRSVREIGSLLARLAELAGEHLQIQHFELTHSDQKTLQKAARQAAVADAAEKAAEIAEAAGVGLGPILEISEGDLPGHIRLGRPHQMSFAATSAGAPMEPGEISTTAQVTVAYQIES
jgi:uncharacterized protein